MPLLFLLQAAVETWDRNELILALGRISRFGKKLGFAKQGLEVFKRKVEENKLSACVALASAAEIADNQARRAARAVVPSFVCALCAAAQLRLLTCWLLADLQTVACLRARCALRAARCFSM